MTQPGIPWEDPAKRLGRTVYELENILATSLTAGRPLFDPLQLKQAANMPPFHAGALASPEPPPVRESYLPPPPTGIEGLWPGAKRRYESQVVEAEQRFQVAFSAYEQREAHRTAQLADLWKRYETDKQHQAEEVTEYNRRIDQLVWDLQAGETYAIEHYFLRALEYSRYPEGFPSELGVAYIRESKQLVVEKTLPGFDVVPEAKAYKYVQNRNEFVASPRPLADRKRIYSSVIAQVALRTLYEIFSADTRGHIDTVVFNGVVDEIDKGTGQPVRPCLITTRTTRDVFSKIDLARVDPVTCLSKALGASVSKSPSELVPVRPVLEFKMVDPRFIQQQDVLSSLDNRTNLMELTPGEFENLISNLFGKMGLETRLTQASRDGGVDCVAYDPRPIFGGKVVIQAKRYRHTVGVSAVRDLFGTVQNEGASKGILVTTSGYGKAAYEFANNKPLELLDGGNLLHLLAEYASIEAKIVVPENWKDPVSDSPE